MLKPIAGSEVEKVPSRYSLVIGIAKRARQIVDAANAAKEPLEEKPVGVAVQEFMDLKFQIVDPPEGESAPVAETDVEGAEVVAEEFSTEIAEEAAAEEETEEAE